MKNDKLSAEDFKDLIALGECDDPLLFLESIMKGHDPRNLSRIYELVLEIADRTSSKGVLKDDWDKVVQCVTSNYKYAPVSVSESMTAGKALAEYVYPKLKQIDLGDKIGSSTVEPLTEEEITLFRDKFNESF